MEKLVVIDQVIQSVFLLMDPLSPLVLLIMMAMELVVAMHASIKILEGLGLR